MAFPDNGIIKIFPASTSIVSGINGWSLNNEPSPQALKSAENLQAYYDTRVTNLAIAPCLRKNVEVPAASGVYVPGVGDYELQFAPSTVGIEFYDGVYPGVPVATINLHSADFPLGMTINSLKVHFTGQAFFGPSRDRDIQTLLWRYFGATVGSDTPTPGVLKTYNHVASDEIITGVPPRWSFIQAARQFGFKTTVNNVLSALTQIPRLANSEIFLLGVYNTQNFQIVNNTPMGIPGDAVNLSGVSLDTLSDLRVYWPPGEGDTIANEALNLAGGVLIPPGFILIQEDDELEFVIPEDLNIPVDGTELIITSEGTTFVGEIEIANLNILLVDGSGVYVLTDEKRNDTYYDRGTTPISTVDLKMPRPKFRTGFF